jgi:hypothetical protein
VLSLGRFVAFYVKYVVLVFALGVLIVVGIWVWVSVRGWLKGLGHDA